MRQTVFIVEEGTELSAIVQHSLEMIGYDVRGVTVSDAVTEAEKARPALILISLLFSGSTGLSLCRRIRENPALHATPLILVLSDAAEEQRIQALESGADDCIVEPFSPRELLARAQALLRRSVPANPARGESPDLLIDSWAMKLSVRGTEIPTTSLEFRLIDYLARHQGQVFTRDLLLDAVWGDMQFVTPRSVDACIRRIREKIEPDRKRPTFLKTIRGVGYRLDAITTWQSPTTDGCDCAACTTAVTAFRMPLESSPKRRRSQA
jgi:DNA-binding response OmpR family regulator